MRKSNFALRLQPSLLDEARKLAEAEGVALNQLINVAVAEKVSALRTEMATRNGELRKTWQFALGTLSKSGRWLNDQRTSRRLTSVSSDWMRAASSSA